MFKKAVSVCLAGFVMASALFVAPAVSAAGATTDSAADISATATSTELSFLNFLAEKQDVSRPNAQVAVPLPEEELTLKEEDVFDAKFNVAEAGLYAVKFTYKCLPGRGSSPIIKFAVNGKYQYEESSAITLKRLWKDVNIGKTNVYGDEIVPSSEEIYEYRDIYLSDVGGFYGGVLYFELNAGENSVTIVMDNESIVVSSIVFKQEEDAKAYKDVAAGYTYNKYDGNYIKIEAEDYTLKSDTTIHRFNDPSSASVTPYSVETKKLNSTGGTSWNVPGMFMVWEIEAPQDGLYTLTFKVKQNTNVGVSSYRNITVDGSYPFAECKDYEFKYGVGYENITLCGEDEVPFLFELSKGKHTIRMEISLGEYANILSYISKSADILSDAYRQIIMLTTADPDAYRDYQIKQNLPEVVQTFVEQEKRLFELRDELTNMFNSTSTGTKVIETLALQLKEFNENYYKITEKLTNFKTNITSLTDWIQDATSQPLQIDSFYLAAAEPTKENAVPSASAGFWKSLKHEVHSFLNTFTDEYLNFTEDDEAVTVWASAGQTSMNAIQELVEDEFIEETGIKVNVQYVTASVLMAIVAGKGPDIALTADDPNIMNWAFRDAVVELNNFDGYDEVMKRFRPSATDQVIFEGKVYALPRTQTWNMMYVRDDILTEQNIRIPNTWDDVISVISSLKKKNLEFGIPLTMFNTFLYQYGGRMYNDDLTATDLTTLNAITAFHDYSQFFTEYSVPKSFSPENRLRTGEMPIVIAAYTLCNTLSLSAPEIEGKWSMHLLPATKREDGSINRAVVADSAYSCILADRNDKDKLEKCWKFLEWWTRDETQYKYCTKMEQVLGVSGRVATANIGTFNQLGWNPKDLEKLNEQTESLVAIYAVPGNYYLTRHLNNALSRVLYYAGVPAEELTSYSIIIDNEITRKREELGYATAKGDE